MKTHAIAISLLFASLVLQAAQPTVRQHVPATVDGLRPIKPEAASYNHLAIVNVDNAIPSEDWNLAVTYAASRFELNVWTNASPRSVVKDLLDGSKGLSEALGAKAKVAVFLEDSDTAIPYLSAPGAWCRVNVRPLKADGPDPQTLRDRFAKAILKGCVYACGAGSSLDGRSAVHFNSMTLKGMDATGITIAPDSYFPMQGYLHLLGGDDILSPAGEEEE